MIWTIASLNICHSPCSIDYEKHGNKYVVSYYNSETKELTSRMFGDSEKATYVYCKLVEYAVNSMYSEADRREMLSNMTC